MFIPSNVTVSDFETYFTRDFVYATVWNNTTTYNTGNIVFYSITNNLGTTFYQSLKNGVTSIPTTIADWTPLAGNSYILPTDITKAFGEATSALPLTLFTKDATAETTYLYLTAHYLYSDVVANGGLSNGGLITSKSVDDVSLHFGISAKLQESPIYSQWGQTYYGRKAITYIYPRSIARTFGVVGGATLCC